ncbi:hypothetical protein GIB67_014772, partial [Kingdonia uniflora]
GNCIIEPNLAKVASATQQKKLQVNIPLTLPETGAEHRPSYLCSACTYYVQNFDFGKFVTCHMFFSHSFNVIMLHHSWSCPSIHCLYTYLMYYRLFLHDCFLMRN